MECFSVRSPAVAGFGLCIYLILQQRLPLPALTVRVLLLPDSRIGCYVTIFQNISNLRDVFYREMSKVRNIWPIWHLKVLVAQSCPTLCNSMDCSLPGSSVHGILQARILEWIAIPFSQGSSWPRDWTRVSCIAGRFFTIWATREARLDT